MIGTTRLLCATAAVVLMGLSTAADTTASAQTYKMTTPFAPGVAVPDTIESSIGTLNLNYGYHGRGDRLSVSALPLRP